MTNITTNVRMDIQIVSKNPLPEGKPHWITIDSTTVVLPNGKEITFDFEIYRGMSEVQSDGRCLVDFTKIRFDKDYYLEFEGQSLDDLDWDQIGNWQFKDVYIIGDSIEGECEDLSNADFEIQNIDFTTWIGFHERTYSVTEKQIIELNEAIKKEYCK